MLFLIALPLSLVLLPCLASQTLASVQNYTKTAAACIALNGLQLSNSTGVRFAVPIIAGSNFTGDSVETSYNALQTDLPEACRVALVVQTSANSSARFEVWLPALETGAWNHRFLAAGNGGWAGSINYPDIVTGLRQGFATMSTDTGHNSTQNDATWTGNSEAMIDFGYRAFHLSTIGTKLLLPHFYDGAEASFSYYFGCSTGGRQGWQEVQRFPSDFDGVLVGAPAIWQTHLPAWEIRVALGQFPNSKASFIPESMWPVIHNAVLRQCDGLDGVLDGLVSDPTRCNFHPEVLACGKVGVNDTECLNVPQIANLKGIYEPWWESNNTKIFDGLSPGGEAGYGFLFNGLTPQFGIDFFKNAIINSSSWNYMTMNGSTIELADFINPGGINAYDPDLTSFQARNGRVIEYHGFQDPIIPSMASGTWYDTVLSFYQDLDKVAEVEEFYRLFMVPGMMHCSDGDGAWVTGSASQSGYPPASNSTEYSLIYSLIDWVENDAAPQELIGTKYVDDVVASGVDFTRPFCRWPTIPVYSGSGNLSQASNWACPSEGFY